MFDNWTGDERVAKYTNWSVHKSIEDTNVFLRYILNQSEIKESLLL